MAMIPHPLAAPGMAVLGALSLASLCAECVAARARLSVEIVLAQIDEMNVARRRRGRRELGTVDRAERFQDSVRATVPVGECGHLMTHGLRAHPRRRWSGALAQPRE